MGVIKILCGLPACGKTFYANSIRDCNTVVVDCDSLFGLKNKKNLSDIYNYIANHLYGHYKRKTVVLDGLFLSMDFVVSIIEYLHKSFKNEFSFEIEYWPEDRDTCLKNDNGRREIASRTTIEKGILDEMTEAELKNRTGLTVPVHIHKTVLKEEYKMMVDNMTEFSRSIKEERYLYSSEWYVNADNPSEVFISKEEKVPSDFIELDEVLEKYFPNITYLQYKRLKRECVELDDFEENDYYTGTVYKARYRCDLKKLYQFIKERTGGTVKTDREE